MSNTPSKAEIEALVKRHGATSYRNRADTQHPAYGFTEDGLNGLIDEVLAKWGTPQPVVREPSEDLYWRLHSLSKILEGSGVIDESQHLDAYSTILDAMAFVRTPQPAPDCHHRPPCDECAALAAQGGIK